MIKFLKYPISRLVRPYRYLFSQDDKKTQVPILSEQINFNFKYPINPNVYGIELSNHIFPSFEKTIYSIQDTDRTKLYQRIYTNYVVAMVRKVIEGENNKQTDNLIDQFYPVSMYCKVINNEKKVSIKGLFRVKIQEINELKVQGVNEADLESQTLETNDKEQEIDESQPKQLKQIVLKKTNGQKLKYYSLKVKKIEDSRIIITPELEIKCKYLVQTYISTKKTIFQKAFLFNIFDIDGLLNQIGMQYSFYGGYKHEVQQLFEAFDIDDRIQKAQSMLENIKRRNNYSLQLENAAFNNLISKKSYQYYSEVARIARQAIDGKKAKQIFIQNSIKEFKQKKPTDEVKKVFQAQIQKYKQMDENSVESSVIKAYIEELSKIPYGIQSNDLFDLDYAREVLDEEHYGMEEVKQFILEIIAVGKLKKTLKGKIFCFVGGPGLGKTTIAKSIAKALNRKFYNISLGGANDSSVLKGHRRTYVGAYSGKIIEALRICGTNNPVILLDEIDKMGKSYQGDPRSQLLQILDPNQNNSFVDNFVDVAVNLSNVLFICSANYEENISKPLLDRMEIIKLSSYTLHQKKLILQQHLLKRAIKNAGLNSQHFLLSPEFAEVLINQYSHGEPGVRYLERNLAKILEKIAYKIVAGEPAPIKVNKDNIHEYIGNSYNRNRDHEKLQIGVAISLGQSNYGGRLTYIETFKKSFFNKKERKRDLLFTGSLGEVFKQAMNISYTYARNFLALTLYNKFLYENQVHIHAPEGALKKDGSTDSLTIAAALISLSLGKKVKNGVALTGELTLQGKVLRTNGIKEKILVAKRQKIRQLIIPYQNYSQVQDLKSQIKEGLVFHFVKQYKEVHNILFPVTNQELSSVV